MDTALSVIGLHKEFPKPRGLRAILAHPFTREKERALSGLDLEIERGTCNALLGPNGAGKSTLLRIIAGTIAPSAGAVKVLGSDAASLGHRLNEKVSLVVGDERSFYARLSAVQNLEFFAAMHGWFGAAGAKRVRHSLSLLDLLAEAQKPFSDLSGGMKQRLSLARGLLADPEILLFDEITRGLDIGQAARFRKLVRGRLAGDLKKTVIFATHNIEEIAEIAQRVFLLHKGALAAQGTLNDVRPHFGAVFAPEDAAET
ncbi:MAG: ABC transporter ATP-binding protein [Deltaproteobacteria bacterium]|nr:ABC transporter ATP-binding protein [Deltaproteobacteria bacterium]